MNYRTALAFIIAPIVACSNVSNTVIQEKKGPAAVLNFIEPLTSGQKYDANPLVDRFSDKQKSSLDSNKEKSIAFYCGAAFEEGRALGIQGVSAAIITFLAGKLANYVVEGSQQAIADKLAAYVAQYSNSKPLRYALYRSVDNGAPVLASRCIRFTRAQDKTIQMDLVAQIHIDGDALGIRPLRLFVEKTAAKSETNARNGDDRKVVLSVALKSDATWLDNRRGRKAMIFQEALFSENLTIAFDQKVTTIGDVNGQVKYYMDENKWSELKIADRIGFEEKWTAFENTLPTWSDYPRLPLIPWSPLRNSYDRYGVATFVMTATESGLKPESIVLVQKLLKENSEQLAKYLKATIVNQFDAEE